ncbi:kinesin-domain-containing protein [Piromyces finnis]|uniref:Kinesin-domain-containing protein n=1 Tax=Piromyces finnis TaxID=1754191 RepID=A0A1Y1VED4_9FUNG|nr:kinesin-domain-containing protein [Piromyces finnis]|eukprot:ORX53879.1 kinesin-domain-containing protein [Piromyces finnis]
MSSVKVAVRVRPFNRREIKKNTKCIVSFKDNTVSIEKQVPNNQIYAKTNDDVIIKTFCFDHCFWSFNKEHEQYASQKIIYDDLGKELLDHAFMGYNTCIFAYGQTGAGKSYTMMGHNEDKGIIPLACEDMFRRIKNNRDENLTFLVEVSYIEIYCERVRDLLNPSNKENLRVREHPILGPYVEDLSKLLVTSHDEIINVMDEGNKSRTVASTKMNEVSSRSHAVFTIKLTQKHINKETNVTTQKESRVSFVDLAGSERINSTKNTGVRLKEGVNINKSLTTLGKVISALAEQSAKNISSGNSSSSSIVKSPRLKSGRATPEYHIPYRDSVLTWLLKDSLGGNSKTVVIAAISPADVNYEETLSTLRFAERAKRVVNTAVINESNNMKLVDELKKEVESLKKELESMKKMESLNQDSQNVSELQDLLSANEKLVNELNMSWEEKLRESENIHKQRENALEDLGITLGKKNDILGLRSPQKIPHLVNLNEDPLMSECLLYQIRPGITRVGKYKVSTNAEILLTGVNVKDNHCYFENNNGTVTLYPNSENNAITLVNGRRIYKPRVLKSGYRVIIGEYHVFRFINPEEARKERNLIEKYNSNINDAEDTISDFSTLSSCDKDWYYAQREKLNREGIYSAAISSADSIAEIQTNDETTSTTSSSVSYKQMRPDISKFEKRNAHINTMLSNIITNYSYLNKENNGGKYSPSLKSKLSISSLKQFSDNGSNKSFDPSGFPNILIQDANSNSNKRCSDDFTRLANTSFNKFKMETRDRRSHSLSYANSRQKPFNIFKHEFQKYNASTTNLELKDYTINPQYFSGEASPTLSPTHKKSLLFRNGKMDERGDRAYLNHFQLIDGIERDPQALMEKFFNFWKSRNFVKLSEAITKNQMNIKQANIISKELNMNIVYQFIVTNDIYPLPKSFWEISLEHDVTISEIKVNEVFEDLSKIKKENDAYIHSFSRRSEHFAKEYPYRLIIKVIDGGNNKIYYWSLNEFLDRLNQMKVIYESNILNNKIVYDPYNNMIDPFRENCKCPFMLVGYSKCLLSSLLYSKYDINYTFRLPIIEWQTGRRKGYLSIKFLSIYDAVEDEYITTENEHGNDSYMEKNSEPSSEGSHYPKERIENSEEAEANGDDDDDDDEKEENISNNRLKPPSTLPMNKSSIKVGTELYFDIIIEKIEGISEDEYTQVHCQFNTSDFNKKLKVKNKKKANKRSTTSNGLQEKSQQDEDNESLFTTNIKTGFKDNAILFNYSQTIHLHVTKNILRNLKYGYLRFEIFGSKPEGTVSSFINDLYTKENLDYKEFIIQEDGDSKDGIENKTVEKIVDQTNMNDSENKENEKATNEESKNIDNSNVESVNKLSNNNEPFVELGKEHNDNENVYNVGSLKEFNDNEIFTINENESTENMTSHLSSSEDDPTTLTDSSESQLPTQSPSQQTLNKENENGGGTLKRLKNRFSSFSLTVKRRSNIIEGFNPDTDLPQMRRKRTIIRKASKTFKKFSSKSDSLGVNEPETLSRKASIISEIPLESINIYRHNIIVSLKICELSADGTYEPVNVQYLSSDDLGAFLIHQGLQRRIELEIIHTSGDSLPIKCIKSFSLSDIRKTGIKSKKLYEPSFTYDQCKPVSLVPLKNQTQGIYKSGKRSLVSTYAWDSSLHESLFLNKETEKETKIVVRVEFDVSFEGQPTPSGIKIDVKDYCHDEEKANNPFNNIRINDSCKMTMDIALIIQNRQESSNIFTSLFSKSNYITKQYVETFNLILNKDEDGQKNCLLQLPKEEVYVRGQEVLGLLKFLNAEYLILQSINMMKKRRNNQMAEFSRQYLYIEDCARQKQKKEEKEEVEEVEDDHTFSFRIPTSPSVRSPIRNADKYISVIYLWKNCTIFKNRIIKRCFYLDRKEDQADAVKNESLLYYTPEFSKIRYTTLIQRKGYLYYPDPEVEVVNESSWFKSYVVIQRPYLYIYKNKNMVDIIDVINLLDAKVSYNQELKKTMNKEFVFEVYTQYHSVILQASNKKDMIQWITTIDPLGVGIAMSNIHQQK